MTNLTQAQKELKKELQKELREALKRRDRFAFKIILRKLKELKAS